MAPGFVAEGVGDDVGHPAHRFFIGAGDTAFAARGGGGERSNGLVDAEIGRASGRDRVYISVVP